MKRYFCQLCRRIYQTKPDFKIAFWGFVWSPEKHKSPLEMFDVCENCREIIKRKLHEAREEAMASVVNAENGESALASGFQFNFNWRNYPCKNRRQRSQNLAGVDFRESARHAGKKWRTKAAVRIAK